MRVEVLLAWPDRHILRVVDVAEGATAADAIAASGIGGETTEVDLDRAPIGIFARTVTRSTVLVEGDRVEIYRPLIADPKTARRERVALSRDRA